MSTDRIEKRILLRAPRERVWRALADSTEFGAWFGMKFDGPFAPGRRLRAVIVPSTIDPEVGKGRKQYEGITFEITIETIKPERLLSFRWLPKPAEPGVDNFQ